MTSETTMQGPAICFSVSTQSAPAASAWAAKSRPSTFSPLIATKIPPECIALESIEKFAEITVSGLISKDCPLATSVIFAIERGIIGHQLLQWPVLLDH